MFVSYQLPDLEGKPNLSALDIQIKKLRDRAIVGIREAAHHMREEATDVKATLNDIEEWLERLQQIADEVTALFLYRFDFCTEWVGHG